MFISSGYDGRPSDKVITESSGILDNLEHGDVVLADRGFLISESVGLRCATLYVPPYTRGKKQLSFAELESTRRMANVRIHVERVIGLVRNKYRILKGPLSIEALSTSHERDVPQIDKIVTVCCCLINLCNSVVPGD